MIEDVGSRDHQSETRPKTVAVDRTCKSRSGVTVRVRKSILIRDRQLRTKVPAQIHKANRISELCNRYLHFYSLVATMTVVSLTLKARNACDFLWRNRDGYPRAGSGHICSFGFSRILGSSSRWHPTRNEINRLLLLHLPQTPLHWKRLRPKLPNRSHQLTSFIVKVSKYEPRHTGSAEHRQYALSRSSTANSVLGSPSVRIG